MWSEVAPRWSLVLMGFLSGYLWVIRSVFFLSLVIRIQLRIDGNIKGDRWQHHGSVNSLL